MFKPTGYPSVSPYLIVDGAAGTIEFLPRTLDGTELRRFAAPAAAILHAEVPIDDGVVMLADRPAGMPTVRSHVHIYVPDVDEVYRRALEAGAVTVQEPVPKDDADKRGGFKDANGTTWWISTRVDPQ